MTIDISKLLERFSSSTTITYESVLEAHNKSPKRICFKTSHANSLREVNFETCKWALFLPFKESIKKVFECETDLTIYHTKKGTFWCPLKNEEEYQKASDFKTKYETNVFLRDNLDLSISLSEHFDNDENRTEIGELEYQAKYQDCEESLNEIVNLIMSFIENTPFYKDTNYICAVPSSNPDEKNLPNQIAELLCGQSDLRNISESVSWKNDKCQLKELSFEDKWYQLVETDMEIDYDLKNLKVILLDDLYQSGTTIQYVAMKLKEAGAKKVYGLTIVKSRRDTDNK
jgi:predicted amidophosphoribosyltransferase